MIYEAHQGVSTEAPGNTMPSFKMAVEQGYGAIELDPSVTKDGVVVVLHDKTLNRTCRLNGKELDKEVEISSITYAELLQYDAGVYKGEQFKGTVVPTLKEVLDYVEDKGVLVKVDNKVFGFSEENKKAVFDVLNGTKAKIAMTCQSIAFVEDAVKNLKTADIHYDGEISEDILKKLSVKAADRNLVVWAPLKTPNTWWVSVSYVDEELSALVKRYAKLGVWILENEDELLEAKRLGADFMETTGSLKPNQK